MTDNRISTLRALAVVALLAALVILAFAARAAYTPPGDLPLTVTAATGTPTASPSPKPSMLPTLLVPTDTATATATDPPYLTDTPAATDTPEPPTATATLFPTPTPEVWQQCRVTAPLRVRSSYSLQADVLRMLAVDDAVTVDANVRPVVADGYRWYALVGGEWVAEGWMVCG